MTLEQAIKRAVERGEFVHLSCSPSGAGFKATFASSSRAGGYSTGEGRDPVVAMTEAINAAPMARLSPSRAERWPCPGALSPTDEEALS